MRALDLFCGAGGATKGLQMAGYHVTGIDIETQPKYCGDDFRRADAMTWGTYEYLHGFDLIWASPPCQAYSHLTPKKARENHPSLIRSVQDRLRNCRTPYVIENVAGAKLELLNPVMLCGTMFGLRCQRHRFFESSFTIEITMRCNHGTPPLLVTTASAASRAIRSPGNYKSVRNAPLAYGIDWMDFRGLKEAIPPAYAEFIGKRARELSI